VGQSLYADNLSRHYVLQPLRGRTGEVDFADYPAISH